MVCSSRASSQGQCDAVLLLYVMHLAAKPRPAMSDDASGSRAAGEVGSYSVMTENGQPRGERRAMAAAATVN